MWRALRVGNPRVSTLFTRKDCNLIRIQMSSLRNSSGLFSILWENSSRRYYSIDSGPKITYNMLASERRRTREILMPNLIPKMMKGNTRWTKKEGDGVLAGEVLCEAETVIAVIMGEGGLVANFGDHKPSTSTATTAASAERRPRPKEYSYSGKHSFTSPFPGRLASDTFSGRLASDKMIFARSYTQKTQKMRREFFKMRRRICLLLDEDYTLAGTEVADMIYTFSKTERAIIFSLILEWVHRELLRASQLIRSVHCLMLKAECLTATGGGVFHLITHYSRIGDYDYAMTVYRKCAVPTDFQAKRALLNMCSVHVFPLEAKEAFNELIDMGQDRPWDYAALVATYGQAGLVEEAVSVFQKHVQKRKTYFPELINNMVSTFGRRGLMKEAYEFATFAMPKGMTLEVCLTLLSCCFDCGERDIAEEVFAYVQSHMDDEARGKAEVFMRNILMDFKDFVGAESLEGRRGTFRASNSLDGIKFGA